MTIDIWEENASSSIYQLEALATGSTRVGEYVRTLDIRRLLANPSPRDRQRGQWGRDKKWAEEKMREFLPVALSALGGVTTVIYKMETKNLEWATILVCEYLATLPMLHTLDLRALHIPPELHPSRISNLNKLVLESDNNLSAIVEIIGGSPNLTELDYHCSGLSRSGVVPSLHHLLSKVPRERPLHLQKLGASGYYYAMLHSEDLPHFRHLKSLELGHGFLSTPWPDGHDRVISSPGDIWTAVTRETPVEAVFAPPDGAVLGYLAVATGIKRIGIFGATSDVSSHNFFTNILPRHSKTLVSLSIAAGPGPWCFGTRGIDALLDCTQLTKLSITIDDTDTTKEQKERLQDTMHHIMKVTTVLPNLYCLRLFPALRGASIALKLQSCRLRKVAHRETSDALHALIVLYPMLNPTIFPRVVKLGGKKYLPQRCSDGATRYAVQD